MYNVVNTGDYVNIYVQAPGRYWQLVDPVGDGKIEVWGVSQPDLNPYSPSNLFVLFRAPAWAGDYFQPVYILAPNYGFLQVVNPGQYTTYAVKPVGGFSTSGLGAWNTFLAQSDPVTGQWAFVFPNLPNPGTPLPNPNEPEPSGGWPTGNYLLLDSAAGHVVLVPQGSAEVAPGQPPSFAGTNGLCNVTLVAQGQGLPTG